MTEPLYLFEELQVGFPRLVMLVSKASHLRCTNMLDIIRLDAATSEATPPQLLRAKQHQYKLPSLRFQL